ncbi:MULTISPECIES: DUF3659 domain-containing protein [Lichenihabitans]|uniref:DUF3659 domain-containing protein n=1 Tax=Lichenihabitans TaxID=2723776 RepID=UPI001035AC89|nr:MULTISPECIES: DUF3659 domain-containing protein [Lichenihabitans]UDL93880.1 DUF3659 domain-containing protein [Lichenihabitans sp. PAMC28606]
MIDRILDSEGAIVARVKDGDVYDASEQKIGTCRNGNVYDRNGKFIFHVQSAAEAESAGSLTADAVNRLFHPKAGTPTSH